MESVTGNEYLTIDEQVDQILREHHPKYKRGED